MDQTREEELMKGIFECYLSLSPENLSHDGERSVAQQRTAAILLQSRLARLQQDLGRTVSETEAYAWGMV